MGEVRPRARKRLSASARMPGGRSLAALGAQCRRLEEDGRFRALKSSHQLILLRGLIRWGNAKGEWWPSYATWSATIGCSARTVQRAVEMAEAAGLLVREAHRRRSGRQGSTTFRLAG